MEFQSCIFEIIAQAIFWYILTDIVIKKCIENVIWDYNFWKRIKGRGKASISSYWTNVSLYPAHATSGIFLIMAFKINSYNLFCHGLLIESGYELFDICKLWYNYYFNLNNNKLFFALFNIHHISNISMIIYLCCNESSSSSLTSMFYILAISLNGLAPITGLSSIICSILDLEKITHKIIWLIFWNMMLFVFAICRFIIFYWVTWSIIFIEKDQNNKLSFQEKLFFMFYVILMTIFNVIIFRIMALREYTFIKQRICLQSKSK